MNEEIKQLPNIVDACLDDAILDEVRQNLNEKLDNVCKLAIKELEQEDVLNKIRAEIANHCGLLKENHCRYCSYCNSLMGVREIIEVIDKYKAESEDNGQ